MHLTIYTSYVLDARRRKTSRANRTCLAPTKIDYANVCVWQNGVVDICALRLALRQCDIMLNYTYKETRQCTDIPPSAICYSYVADINGRKKTQSMNTDHTFRRIENLICTPWTINRHPLTRSRRERVRGCLWQSCMDSMEMLGSW